MHFGIALEPRELFFCIYSCVLSHTLESERKLPLAIKDVEEFLVAHCVQGIAGTKILHAHKFLPESCLHHLPYTCVYTLEKLRARTVKAYFHYLEGTFLRISASKRTHLAPCLVYHLESVHHAARVPSIDLGKILGVKHAQFFDKGTKPLSLQTMLHNHAHRSLNGRYVVESSTNGIDVKHASTAQDDDIPILEQGGKQPEHVLLILRSTVIVGESKCSDKVMPHLGLFFRRRCGCSYGQVAIYLPRIGVDDGRTEAASQLYGNSGLSYCRRPRQNKQRLQG